MKEVKVETKLSVIESIEELTSAEKRANVKSYSS